MSKGCWPWIMVWYLLCYVKSETSIWFWGKGLAHFR